MKLRAHHHLVIASLLLFGISSVWAWGQAVFATDSSISVTIGSPDVCPNIPGYQAAIPNGMQLDVNGDCYTPPPAIDVCANIAGNQAVIPNGYYRDDATGNCYVQPAPAIDVCPNLSGTQTVVPLGYQNDSNGNCVAIPKDMCSNIDGIQATVPEGMTRDDQGVCVTPVTPPPATTKPTQPSIWSPPSSPRTPTPSTNYTSPEIAGSTDLKNVPGALEPVIAPIVNVVPESVKTALRSLPPVVAQTFPYYIFGILGVGALFLWAQALQEVAAARTLLVLLKRERSIAEEKDNFIALAAHYLRTPLTLMTSGLDTIKALKELPEPQVDALRLPIVALDDEIKRILSEVENNSELQGIAAPMQAKEEPSFLRSAHFWVPVIVSIVITLIANFFLGVVGEVEIGTLNLWLQILTFFMVGFCFYTAIRNRHTKKINRARQEQLVAHERSVDKARNAFIDRATTALRSGLTTIASLRSNINGAHSAKFFDDGYGRFEAILTKFMLLSQIRAGSDVREETFDLRAAVDSAVARYTPQAQEKQLTIVNNVTALQITQRRALFEFVLGSLLDNAIKFSHAGGTIQVGVSPSEHKIALKVSDYGSGISKDKIPQLFKPFSRADSALEFNYEGLGFSLYLDKIIMDYLGGTIHATSEPEKGSTFTVVASRQPRKTQHTVPATA